MPGQLRVLGLIPARGGSKGVARKNVRLLGGRPLLQYTADSAMAATRLARVVLSTEDAEIAEVGRRCGLDVPFRRPADLARDDTPMLSVVQHALRAMTSAGEDYDAVCLLQPTSPLRTAEEIDACISLLETSGADSVVTVLPIPDSYHPFWAYLQAPDGTIRLSTGAAEPITRRQDLPPAVHREGSIYVALASTVLAGNSLYGARTVGYLVRRPTRLNIDTDEDWRQAEQLFMAAVAGRES